jgi:sec-independent protein translocase protein TatC
VEEVRWRLIWLLVTFAVAAAAGFALAMYVDVLGVLIDPIEPFLHGAKLKYLSPTEPFFVTLRIGIMLGAALALPALVYHLWGILRPMLDRAQRRLVLPSLLAALALFVGGVVFCFLAVVPLMLRFTMGFQTESLEQSIVIGAYLSLVLHMLVAFGLAFELPIVMLIGTALGILTPEMLAAKRRHALAGAVILGALLTPPDIASQLLMAVPLYLLYEIGIVVSRVVASRGVGASYA